jgi:hypothetical protein
MNASKLKGRRVASDEDAEPLMTLPPEHWRKNIFAPDYSITRAPEAVKLSAKELADKIDSYFASLGEDAAPSFCDLAGHVGFDSIPQMINHARRCGGEVMRYISRGFLAVGSGYEELGIKGQANFASKMLEHLPSFDSVEPQQQAPQYALRTRTEMSVQLTGLARREDYGKELTEQEAYQRLIKNRMYEEVAEEVIEAVRVNDGEFVVLELERV